MHDDMRKSFLRKLAFEEGLDYDIAYRPKKAAQYGTGIDKILRKKILKDTDMHIHPSPKFTGSLHGQGYRDISQAPP